jgi:predicted ATPase/transcriptional regulator with XRE-family HTH domain
MEPPTFADLLRYHRLAAGLSQEALAERSEVSLQAISLLERGRRHGPRRQTVLALAEALGLAAAPTAALDSAARRRRRPRPEPPPRPAGLPPTAGALLGRATDLAVLPFLLRQTDGRLLTLVGPAGVGKTRLALETAVLTAPTFPAGITWVDLAPIREAGLVAPTMAGRLGLRTNTASYTECLIAHLRDRDTLLVLDNFEQVLPAGALLQELLDACPTLRILATSRVALGSRSERVWALAPLALPPPGEVDPRAVLDYPSVALFLERARAVVPNLARTAATAAVVAAVCRRLDGLPLAIELAAARARLVPPQAMLARLEERDLGSPTTGARDVGVQTAVLHAPPSGGTLDLLTAGGWDRPDRQQTMRHALAWSYELLTPAEQAMFRGLGVFVGGWSTDTAADVLGRSVDAMAAGLEALSAKHLVRQAESAEDGARFGMLETIREYAWEHLSADEHEMARVRDRHLAWFVALAEEADPRLKGPEQGAWLARLDREHHNLRAALRWARERQAGVAALRLVGTLWRFWLTRGYLSEGRAWLEEALGADEPAPADVRARALTGAGVLAGEQGDHIRAAALFEEALILRRPLGDSRLIADSIHNLAQLAKMQREYGRAIALHEEALALYRALDYKPGIAIALTGLGNIAGRQGDHQQATALHEEALALYRLLEDTQWIAGTLGNLGNAAHNRGDYARAAALHEEALAVQRTLGDQIGVTRSLHNLALGAYVQGDYARTTALLEEAVPLCGELGDRELLAEGLEIVAWVAVAQGHPGKAARLAGAADALRQSLGLPLAPDQQADHEQAVRIMRAALGEEEFGAGWAKGYALSPVQAGALVAETAAPRLS